MSEGIKPGYPDAYHSKVPQFSHRDSSPALNLASTSKINGPDFSFLASQFFDACRGVAHSIPLVARELRYMAFY